MANVLLTRTDTPDSKAITDGQIIFDTGEGNIFLDNGDERIPMGSGKGAKEITLAEYNALTTEEKNNGTLYAIKDKNASSHTAKGISYDSYESALGATNVQDAIDKLSEKARGMSYDSSTGTLTIAI